MRRFDKYPDLYTSTALARDHEVVVILDKPASPEIKQETNSGNAIKNQDVAAAKKSAGEQSQVGKPKLTDSRPALMQKSGADKRLPHKQWIALDPTEGKIVDKAMVRNGMLICNARPDQDEGGFLKFPSIRAKNMTLRAQVKRPNKKDGHLALTL